MKRIIILTFLVISTLSVFAQNERKFIRNGNKLFMEAVQDTSKVDTIKFSNAETEYRKALNEKPADSLWNFNLADAMYKQQRFEEAADKFEELAEKMQSPVEKARAYHNLGNSQLMQQKLDESIEAYKKALRQNPDDLETKYNLAFAQQQKKKQEEQEQKNKDQNKDQDKDKDKDKDDQNKDQQDQNKDQNKDQQDKKNQDQQNKDKQNQDQQKQQQQPQQNKISKQDAEQLLQALQNDEKKIQDKVKKEKAAKAKRTRTEKEW